MELPLVVGADGSEPSPRAVDRATEKATLHGVPLRLTYASLCSLRKHDEGPALAPGLGRSVAQVRADDIVHAAARRAHRPGTATDHPAVRPHRRTAEGSAPQVLLDASAPADLPVVGARRRHGHVGMRLGPVRHGVLRCPVAVVPHRA
ncbi:universal stress protein [Streptomyces sp. NPDC054842]